VCLACPREPVRGSVVAVRERFEPARHECISLRAHRFELVRDPLPVPIEPGIEEPTDILDKDGAGPGGFVVWLTGHALDVLALLSPIPLLDLVLKACRVAIFLIVGILTAVDWRIALVVSLIVIGICGLCFWWAFRLAVFGAIFSWDLLRSRLLGRRSDPSLDGEVLGFTAYPIAGLGKRSFGALRGRIHGCSASP